MRASPPVERPRSPSTPHAPRSPLTGGTLPPPSRSRLRRRAAGIGAALALASAFLLAFPLDGPQAPPRAPWEPEPGSRGEGEARAQPPQPAPQGPRGVAGLARQLNGAIAAPWPALQARSGRFRNMLGGGTRYGEAALGYALLQAGARSDDRAQIRAGLRALRFAIAKSERHSRASVFENLAVAAAYNVARRSLADHARFRRYRPAFEDFLRARTFKELGDTSKYSNHYLADALTVLELHRSGLSSPDPASLVGPNRAAAAAAAASLVNVKIPELAARRGVDVGGRRVFVLSDPPDDPLAYQGLSLGMYARAVRLMGPRAAPAARQALAQAAGASWLLTAPDGDLAWAGRSQHEGWALAGTAYGAAAAANLPGTSRRRAADLRGLAQRALTRLARAHGTGSRGFFITPSLRAAPGPAGARGIDDNAGQPSFTGLALMLLNWTVPELRGDPVASDELFSDRDGGTVLSQGMGRFAVVRRGDVWLSVRMRPSDFRSDDLRYDFGLSALKVRRGGRWEDVAPARPKTGIPPSRLEPRLIEQGARAGQQTAAAAASVAPDSAGPVLRAGGQVGLPYGDSIAVARDGTVTVTGGWRTAGGAILRSGATFTFEPIAHGVRMTFPRQPGDRLEYSAFLRTSPERRRSGLTAGGQRVSFSPRARVRVQEGYASAADAALLRARLRFGAAPSPAPARVKLTTAGPSGG